VRRAGGLKELLWVLSAFGAVAIIARLLGGLGATTALSDSMPWGMWKILNMVAGVALATGGFALAAAVRVFELRKYEPALRPAILIALLGYGSSCFALALDIGLPHAIWKPIVFWNHHSFLFEVAWCVMLYFTVTILETAPIVLENTRGRWLAGLLHRASLPIVIVGITLSTLHHTSLGSLFLVMPARLHELWFTPWIPLLFIVSAVGAGIQTVILVSLGYSWIYGRERNMPVLTGLAKGSAVILSLYLILKIVDLAVRGQIGTLFSGQWEAGFFFAELALGAVIPIALIAARATRHAPVGLTVASISAVLGLVLNRLNVGVTGLLRTADAPYFPSLPEISLSIGVIAMAALALVYIVENYPIFEDIPAKAFLPGEEGVRELDPLGRAWTFGWMTGRARLSMLLVVSVSLAAGLFSGSAFGGMRLKRAPVRQPLGADAARATLFLDGDRNDEGVLFPHDAHKERLGGEESCQQCHHQDLPGDHASSCFRCHADMAQPSSVFDHETHVAELGDKWSCVQCHDSRLPKNVGNSKPCHECHEEDMGLKAPETVRAMHPVPSRGRREERRGEARRMRLLPLG